MKTESPLGLNASDRLLLLRRLDHLRKWASLDDKRYCVCCGKIITGRQIEAVGEKLAADNRVSHCYWRPTFPDWPYPLFSMVHCESRDQVQTIVRDLSANVGVSDYEILWSARELKKERVRYFVDDASAPAAV